jgi:hypothetical protein
VPGPDTARKAAGSGVIVIEDCSVFLGLGGGSAPASMNTQMLKPIVDKLLDFKKHLQKTFKSNLLLYSSH